MKNTNNLKETLKVVFVTTKWLLINYRNNERTFVDTPEGTVTSTKTKMTVEHFISSFK